MEALSKTTNCPRWPLRKMSLKDVLGLLPKTECSEWFVLGLGFAGLWVYSGRTSLTDMKNMWQVTVNPVEPGVGGMASSAPTKFYGRTRRVALEAMAKMYGGLMLKDAMYIELYGEAGGVSEVKFPGTLSELRMKMELRGWNLSGWEDTKIKRKVS